MQHLFGIDTVVEACPLVRGTLDRANEFVDWGMPGRPRAPVLREADAYFRGEKFAGTRILLYWLTIIACALGRNA
jgi:hypothetical protein